MDAGIESLINANNLPKQKITGGESTLGKDDFLKLMMIQMRYQDPLNPLDNAQMLSQMAQFTSLEQLSNLNTNLTQQTTLSTYMDSTRLLGKEVTIIDPSSPDESPTTLRSKVQSIAFTQQGAVLGLENGIGVTLDQVLTVSDAQS